MVVRTVSWRVASWVAEKADGTVAVMVAAMAVPLVVWKAF